MILVEIRCVVCGRSLDNVASAPTSEQDWATWVAVQICGRHGAGAGHGNVAAWRARRRRAGQPDGRVQVRKWIPWTGLRPAVEKARRTGKTQVHSI